MARSGGYLDQPRRWQTLIRFMNERYGRMWDEARETLPDAKGRKSNEWQEEMSGAGEGFGAMLGN